MDLRLVPAEPHRAEMTPAHLAVHLVAPVEQVVDANRVVAAWGEEQADSFK